MSRDGYHKTSGKLGSEPGEWGMPSLGITACSQFPSERSGGGPQGVRCQQPNPW